jgi:hypothetical protein
MDHRLPRMSAVGDRIRVRRLRENMTQETLALTTGPGLASHVSSSIEAGAEMKLSHSAAGGSLELLGVM